MGRPVTGRGATPRAIVALDVASVAEALALVDRLGDSCDFYKVGSELYTAAGPAVVRQLRDAGRDVFLDLKFHDIPHTVRSAARVAASLDVALLTVHASGGSAMLEAAVDGAGAGSGVLAVTVLTSLDAESVGKAWGREVERVEGEVIRLAGQAAAAGVHGIVCAGSDASAVRERFGDTLALLVPGIRLSGGDSHDQRRVVTPRQAVEAGARYLVIGRTVTAAADPERAMRSVLADMRGGSAAAGTR